MSVTNPKYAPRRMTEQLDDIADHDIEFRNALDDLVNSVQFTAIGALSDDEVKGGKEGDIGLLIDIVSAKFLAMRRLYEIYWPCGCTVSYVNGNCGGHSGPC